MTAFDLDLKTEIPDRVYVEVNRRFNVAIIRTEVGLELRVYPRTEGDLWYYPFVTFEVDESEIIDLEVETSSECT